MVEPLRLGLEHISMFSEKFLGAQQDIIEVNGARVLERSLITTVSGCREMLSIGTSEISRARWPHAA